MAKKVRRVPKGYHTATPHLVVKGASKAIQFYKKAFGAKELARMTGPGGQTIMHAELQIGDSRIFLNDEFPDWGVRSPESLGGSPVTIHLYVENANTLFKRAVKAGANATMPIQDMFWGDRYGKVTDPFGHEWAIASHIEDLTVKEIKARAAKAFAGG
jgi:PhnB protein